MEKETTLIQTLGLEVNKSRFLSSEELTNWMRVEYKIDNLINDFWGVNCKSNLIAVSNELDNKMWRGLVSEWDGFSQQPGQFRLSQDLVKNLLDLSLGENEFTFSLKKITNLEMAVFENFFVEFENFWRDYWSVAVPNSQGNLSFLIWAVELDNQEVGYFAIGVPPGLVPKRMLPHQEKGDLRVLARDLNVAVPLDLTVGKTRLSINEVKNIDSGDLIVFEESDTRRFTWDKNELQQMNINIALPDREAEHGANIFLDNLEMGTMMEKQQTHDDLLADLPIELAAQFKGVNMPLHKVMELEVGGVLPLGLLLDSELVLMAPGNKAIAQGELVVVGNQFGLKIQKVNLKGDTEPPQGKLSAAPDVNPALLEEAMSSGSAPMAGAPAEAPIQQEAAVPGDQPPVVDEEISKRLDQELQDIGIDPDELEDLDDDFGDDF